MDILKEIHENPQASGIHRARRVKNKYDYKLDGHVAIVTMKDGDNLINPDFIHEGLGVLNDIEQFTNANVLVFHSTNPKVFSLGMDIDWALKVIEKGDKDRVRKFFLDLNSLFLRILLYPMPTIAAINGHVFGIGLVFSCCFDFRFIRSDRGYLCLPEVDLGIPLLPGMVEILRRAMTTSKLEEMQYTGRRYTAQECQDSGIATRICPGDKLLEEVMGYAKNLDKKRSTIAEMKNRMNENIVKIIMEKDPQYISKGETIYA